MIVVVSSYRHYPVNTDEKIKRRCVKCKKLYPAIKKYFKGNITKSLGIDYTCKVCDNTKKRNTFIPANIDVKIKRKCGDCGKNYPATTAFFEKDKSLPLGLKYICKWCIQPRSKKYRERVGNEISTKWYWDNRDEFLTYCKLRKEKLGLDSRRNTIGRMYRLKGRTA
jgi:hypothetical protein